MGEIHLIAAWFAARYMCLVGDGRRTRNHEIDPGPDHSHNERGDVPGWVMVTVMTAALVVAILGVFRGKITDAITNALDSVTGKAAG